MYVGDNPVSYYDPYGWWKKWTHGNLVEGSWDYVWKNEFSDSMKAEMSYYEDAMLAMLISENQGVDSGDTFNNHAWHFGRGTDENIQDAIDAYDALYKENIMEIVSLNENNRSKSKCDNIFRLIGMQSHQMQDYYAHAIALDSNGWLGTIGRITGSSYNVSDKVKPASYDDWPWMKSGEHGWIEPGKQAPDKEDREARAKHETIALFSLMITRWWDICGCFAEEIFNLSAP
jgi:hypothetical protein